MWQETDTSYAASNQGSYYNNNLAPQNTPLQFYSPDPNAFYPGSRPSLDGHAIPQGAISQQSLAPGYGGNIQSIGGWWTAFGTGGFEGEPPLLEGTYTKNIHGD